MTDTDIGFGKTARRAYRLDEVSIVPSRRTRDPRDVDISWQIDAYRFDIPVLGASTDAVTSPATAIRLGELGGLGVLDLEGLWTRHTNPGPALAEVSEMAPEQATMRLRELYAAPVQPELITARISEIAAAGVRTAARVRPPRAKELAPHAFAADVELLVIAGTVVSAEHVSSAAEPLNLKTFIRGLETPVVVGGCVSYQAALHLMRTGAAGILVGAGSGHAGTSRHVLGLAAPQATAIADARAARMRHLDETGVYCHVIADDAMATAGEVAKAIVCGADAVDAGIAAGFGFGLALPRQALDAVGGPHASAAQPCDPGDPYRHAQRNPPRPGTGSRRHHQHDGRPEDLDGQVRLHRREGLSASRAGRGGPMTASAAAETVVVVDFGAQYSQLIARRVREAEVYSEIVAPTVTAAEIAARRPVGVILSGGPASVNTPRAPRLDPGVYDLGVARAGNLLRGATDGPAARRRGCPQRKGRIRTHRVAAHRTRTVGRQARSVARQGTGGRHRRGERAGRRGGR